MKTKRNVIYSELSDTLKKRLERDAARQVRSVAAQVRWIIERHYEDRDGQKRESE